VVLFVFVCSIRANLDSWLQLVSCGRLSASTDRQVHTLSSLMSFFVRTFNAVSASCRAGRAFSSSAATWAAMTFASSVSLAILVASACT